jgi:hypothetical protein
MKIFLLTIIKTIKSENINASEKVTMDKFIGSGTLKQ